MRTTVGIGGPAVSEQEKVQRSGRQHNPRTVTIGARWARIVFADPLWPKKARGQIAEPIVDCTPTCSLCFKRIIAQKPAYCARWPKERRERFLERVGG